MVIIDEKLLEEFRQPGACEWCGYWYEARQPHHLLARGMGAGRRIDHKFNLISLCYLCHNDVHNGKILKCDLLAVVSRREGKLQDEIEAEVNRIRRLPKPMGE